MGPASNRRGRLHGKEGSLNPGKKPGRQRRSWAAADGGLGGRRGLDRIAAPRHELCRRHTNVCASHLPATHPQTFLLGCLEAGSDCHRLPNESHQPLDQRQVLARAHTCRAQRLHPAHFHKPSGAVGNAQRPRPHASTPRPSFQSHCWDASGSCSLPPSRRAQQPHQRTLLISPTERRSRERSSRTPKGSRSSFGIGLATNGRRER